MFFVDWSSKVWPCCWFATENFEDHEYYHMLINEFGETWNNLKAVMSEGSIPYIYKEMIYIAVSIINNCNYFIYPNSCISV